MYRMSGEKVLHFNELEKIMRKQRRRKFEEALKLVIAHALERNLRNLQFEEEQREKRRRRAERTWLFTQLFCLLTLLIFAKESFPLYKPIDFQE